MEGRVYTVRLKRPDREEIDPVRIRAWSQAHAEEAALEMYPGSKIVKEEEQVMDNVAYWAIAYHTNGFGPRARRWYRISRLIQADGQWFELYWHPDNAQIASASQTTTRRLALEHGLELMPGVWRRTMGPRGGVMERVPNRARQEVLDDYREECKADCERTGRR